MTSVPAAGRVFLPRTVAIVGASDSNEGFSAPLFDNLRAFDGTVYLINPRRTTLWDQPCYPDFARIGVPIDLALVVTPGHLVAGVLEEGAASGLRAALLYNEAFGKPGSPQDAQDAERVLRLCAAPDGLRVAGPNSLGAIAVASGGAFYPMRSMGALPAGNVGIVSASGGALQHWMVQGAARGLGFSYAVSVGNELDLGVADYIEFLTADAATRVICVIAEGVREPRAFARAAAAARVAGKPIVIFKSGRSVAAQRAAASHTGALAGDDAVFDAVCARYGMCRVDSLDELLEITLAFSAGRLPSGDGVAMLCHSGGIKGAFLDAADAAGLRLAELTAETRERLRTLGDFPVDNPLDGGMRLAIRADEYVAVVQAVAADPNVDILAVQGRLPTKEAHSPHKLAAYDEIRASVAKPVVAFERMAYNVERETSAAAALPFLHGIPETAQAVAALIRYAAFLRHPPDAPAAIEAAPIPRSPVPPDPARVLRERLLECGITFPREVVVYDRAGALMAAEEIGYPLVVKAASATLHKTELDAVRLGIRNATELKDAIDDIAMKLAHANVIAAGFLLQEMVEGVELIAGAREDPQFGTLLVVGLGGTAAEALHDVAIRLLPITPRGVLEMLDSLRGRALLNAFRGRPARDLDAIAAAAAGLGQTFLECRTWLADLEINPLIAGPAGSGARAVDLRFTIRDE